MADEKAGGSSLYNCSISRLTSSTTVWYIFDSCLGFNDMACLVSCLSNEFLEWWPSVSCARARKFNFLIIICRRGNYAPIYFVIVPRLLHNTNNEGWLRSYLPNRLIIFLTYASNFSNETLCHVLCEKILLYKIEPRYVSTKHGMQQPFSTICSVYSLGLNEITTLKRQIRKSSSFSR